MKPIHLFMLFAAAIATACGPRQTKSTGDNTSQPNSTMILRGRLVVAHEVRAFTPEGDTTEYWVVDPSGALERQYDLVSGGSTSGMPLRAELELRYKGPSDEGFAAEYAGVFEVVGIRSMERE